MTSGIPEQPLAHQHVQVSHAVLRLFRLMEETLKKLVSQLSIEERSEGIRMHSPMENSKTEQIECLSPEGQLWHTWEIRGNLYPATTLGNLLVFSNIVLDCVFSLITFSIASALPSEKLKLSEQRKTDQGYMIITFPAFHKGSCQLVILNCPLA